MVVESDVREAEKFATAWKYLQGRITALTRPASWVKCSRQEDFRPSG